jgi:predicted metal-dependent hydrolase
MKVNIVRSIKRRSVSIQILSDTSIKVSIPFFFTPSQVNKLLKEKEDWITQHQQMFKMRRPKRDLQDEFLYLGKTYPLEIRLNQKNIIEVSDKLYLGSPNKKYAKTYITSWYKQQARKIIVERVHHYASMSGLKFKSINLTSATTRWGSCSSEKNLNFNWKLIMAPLEVIDYVVAHELAHLEEMNHSRDFWETVRKMFPLYRQYRTWLKRNGHTLSV